MVCLERFGTRLPECMWKYHPNIHQEKLRKTTKILFSIGGSPGKIQTGYPFSLYPWGKNPSTQWRGVWVDPRAVLDNVVKRKSLSCGELNRMCCPLPRHKTGWAVPAWVQKLTFKNISYDIRYNSKWFVKCAAQWDKYFKLKKHFNMTARNNNGILRQNAVL
jgi:hypothetical protein